MEHAESAPAKYASVNGAWPAELPALSDEEAIELVRRLYCKFMGRRKCLPIKIASGNRHTWVRRGVWHVNPRSTNGWRFGFDNGWREIVHSVSHYVHWRKFPSHKNHDGTGTHAWIERQMIEHVVKSGWLDGKLKPRPKMVKPAPTADEIARAKLTGLDARIKRWESKRRRAETALAKLARQRRRLVR